MADKLHPLNPTFRVAAAVPVLHLADVAANLKALREQVAAAAKQHVDLVVFPELSLTGYTLGDLVQQPTLLAAAEAAVVTLAELLAAVPAVAVVGLPLGIDGKLYNCGAVLYRGVVVGLVPKTYLPNYGEFYEQRWYASGTELTATEVRLGGQIVPIGSDLLFDFPAWPGLKLGVEICEDLWAPIPPSSLQAVAGATVIANLSASNELVGKAGYRRDLVTGQAGRSRCAYIYSSTGVAESTTDVVFGGHAMIAENGSLLAENKRFERTAQLIVADLNIKHLTGDRQASNTFVAPAELTKTFRTLAIDLPIRDKPTDLRRLDPAPFVPGNPATRAEHSADIFNIQAAGLATRLANTGINNLVIGVSGGLDSTLALLVAGEALNQLGLPPNHLHAFTLPGFATSHRTKNNAVALAKALGVSLETIDITAGATQQLSDIGHPADEQDVTYENVQARYRTMILMNQANQLHGLVVGTGDLSEIALGWSTFNGDHISHYNVNAGVPKTLVKHLVAYAAELPEFAAAKLVLQDILATPISPELKTAKPGELSQATEDLIGPYELHDFFLYHFLRWRETPEQILALAEVTFAGQYEPKVIKHWLQAFLKRFFANQWKRSVMADGPKVGSVALSPRGDWRMPSDVSGRIWQDALE
jgi:NAD+ synthase (glutamine-hydrolysing)